VQNLLSREVFRESVFARDKHRCVFCDAPAQDAHHILERRLWIDGGYYLANGASVCGPHHLACEQTTISPDEVRRACGIAKAVIPEHLYDDESYDKWGNPVLANGTRLRGELFDDPSVQKVLRDGGVLPLFTKRIKYPRTYHLPWSQGVNDDDRTKDSMDTLRGKRVIVTTKMDGENTTLYNDYLHARSIDSPHHASRDWMKNFWSHMAHDIPDDFRVCGENLFAEHAIGYTDLPSYFLGFSVWNGLTCLSWDDTTEWLSLLGVEPVPVIYDGIYNEKAIVGLYQDRDWERCEGYVVRNAEAFSYSRFRHNVAKFVRRNHVQTAKHHWRSQKVIPNGLARERKAV
jgi:hypothetical protein